MASSFKMARDFCRYIQLIPNVQSQNFLMAVPTKDLAILCTLLSDDEKENVLEKIALRKKEDVISEITHLRHVRIRESQYVKILFPLIQQLRGDSSQKRESYYFRPAKKR